MKKRIQTLAVIAFVLLGFTQVNAQRGMKELSEEQVKEMKENRLKRMADHLKLSENQIAQIRSIDAQYINQEKAIHDEMKALREANKPKREAMKEEIEAVLTPEQRKKAEEKRAQFKEKHDGKRKEVEHGFHAKKGKKDHEGRKGKRLTKMKEELGLSDTQVAQIKSIKEKYKPTEAEKENKKALMQKKKALRESKMKEINKVLNADQQSKMKEMHKRKKRQHFKG